MIKVVIVEDEELIRQGLRLTMNWDAFGCQVMGEAADGVEGMQVIERLQPDLVFTDIRMPKMTGLEMMEQLQGKTRADFIILSGFDEFSYAKKAIELGAKGYLLKPIDDAEFEEVLQKAVATIQSRNAAPEAEEQQNHHLLGETYQDKYLQKACQIMRDRQGEDLTLKMVADELAISDSYLGKLFKNKSSYTFLDVLTFYRVKAAVEMLENTDRKVYEIAELVGYSDSKYFSKIFQKIVGVKPTEYRNGYYLAPGNILNELM